MSKLFMSRFWLVLAIWFHLTIMGNAFAAADSFARWDAIMGTLHAGLVVAGAVMIGALERIK